VLSFVVQAYEGRIGPIGVEIKMKNWAFAAKEGLTVSFHQQNAV